MRKAALSYIDLVNEVTVPLPPIPMPNHGRIGRF
jgi:hypothetical protein